MGNPIDNYDRNSTYRSEISVVSCRNFGAGSPFMEYRKCVDRRNFDDGEVHIETLSIYGPKTFLLEKIDVDIASTCFR